METWEHLLPEGGGERRVGNQVRRGGERSLHREVTAAAERAAPQGWEETACSHSGGRRSQGRRAAHGKRLISRMGLLQVEKKDGDSGGTNRREKTPAQSPTER